MKEVEPEQQCWINKYAKNQSWRKAGEYCMQWNIESYHWFPLSPVIVEANVDKSS